MLQSLISDKDLQTLHRNARFIGGGTCCGKTTIASLLAERYGLQVFSVDDYLGKYAELAGHGFDPAGTAPSASEDQSGNAVGRTCATPDFERMWMRNPAVQLDEMLRFYEDIFPYVMTDVAARCAAADGQLVIAEGIAFLPELLCDAGMRTSHCAFLAMEQAIHDERYAARDWTSLMFEGCSDPARAFELWMQRDDLFSQHVINECASRGLLHIESDATCHIESVLRTIVQLWKL